MAKSTKAEVVLIQDAASQQVRKVRINGTEIAVAMAAPVVANGTMAVTLTIADVDVSVETAPAKGAPA